ncbi:MAG TPA: thioesterase [Acidimicrobiaceae bacterium]|nr:thioesterase [Acidimicrobiaceae bacterium]
MSTTGDSAPQISGTAESAKECADWQALLERIPYAQHLGLEVQRGDVGVLVHLPCREALIGNFMLPALHGGVLGALIELTARVAAQSQDTDKRCPRIIDSHINYLRSAKARSTFARAEIVRQGRRSSLVSVTCWQGEESKPIASGQVQLLLPTIAAEQEELHDS